MVLRWLCSGGTELPGCLRIEDRASLLDGFRRWIACSFEYLVRLTPRVGQPFLDVAGRPPCRIARSSESIGVPVLHQSCIDIALSVGRVIAAEALTQGKTGLEVYDRCGARLRFNRLAAHR